MYSVNMNTGVPHCIAVHVLCHVLSLFVNMPCLATMFYNARGASNDCSEVPWLSNSLH